MLIVRSIKDLAQTRAAGGVLVPTMGSLHEGHGSLFEAAREKAGDSGTVIVSLFVNPTQFNEATDFTKYPRDFEADCDVCRSLGVDIVFAPPPEVMYPPGEDVPVGDLPAVATEPGLEDAHRPGHFAGVCQVVRRLFVLANPEAAVFGEKDWQQLQAVRAMSEGEGLGVDIVAAATVREPDGLAMSSRNLLLSPEGREAAAAIPRALEAAGSCETTVAAEVTMLGVLARAGLEVEYAAVRDALDLGGVRDDRGCRALIAARAGGEGGVRLIDNAPWPAVEPSDD